MRASRKYKCRGLGNVLLISVHTHTTVEDVFQEDKRESATESELLGGNLPISRRERRWDGELTAGRTVTRGSVSL
jgi:hypothetical protein